MLVRVQVRPKLKKRQRFNFDQLRQRLILTPAEKRVVIFILVAFLLGLGTKYYRDAHSSPAPSQSNLNTTRARNHLQAELAPASSVTPARKRTRKSAGTEKLNLSEPIVEHEHQQENE
jgi:hypothetical protein